VSVHIRWERCTPELLKKAPEVCYRAIRRPVLELCIETNSGPHFHVVGHEHGLLVGILGTTDGLVTDEAVEG
jgi:hypothetical protein